MPRIFKDDIRTWTETLKLTDKKKLHNLTNLTFNLTCNCDIFLSVSSIISVQVRIFSLSFAFPRWWKKYLSKRSLIKHTYSCRDKLIILKPKMSHNHCCQTKNIYHPTSNHNLQMHPYKKPFSIYYVRCMLNTNCIKFVQS